MPAIFPNNISCPHCKISLEVPQEVFNCEIECPSCEQDFVVSQEIVDQALQAEVVKSLGARAKRSAKKKPKKSIAPYVVLVLLGVSLYFFKGFYDDYQTEKQARILAEAKQEEAEALAFEKAEQEKWKKSRAEALKREAEREARLKAREEREERLAAEQQAEEERLAAEKQAEQEGALAEEKRLEEEKLKADKLAARKLAAKKKRERRKRLAAQRKGKAPIRVIEYQAEIGSKKHNQEMNNTDAQRIQDELKVFPADDPDLDKKIQGMRYHNQCLISPLGQLGGHGVAIRRDKGLYLYRLDPEGILAKAGLKEWDRVLEVNKEKLGNLDANIKTGEGPIVVFGEQLDKAEGKGEFVLRVRRGEKEKDFKIKVKKRFSFPKEDFGDSSKGESLLTLSLKILDEIKSPDFSWPSGYGTRYSNFQIPLAFLSADGRRYKNLLKKSVYNSMELDRFNWSWGIAMKTILMAEYFWATGDMKVYQELQETVDVLTTYINPTGGVAQKFNEGTYWGTNFGPTASLTCLALSLSEKCGVAYDHPKRMQQFENYTANKNGYISGYNGYLSGSEHYIGERGFTTSAIALALAVEGSERTIIKNITSNLSANFRELPYIHGTPSQGLVFGSMALARMNPKAFKKFQDYFRWYLTLSHLPDNNLFYITPRHSRMAIPGGGGWNGDSILGFQQMACLQVALILSADRQNLLMTGSKRPGTITGNKNVLKDVQAYHEKRVKEIYAAGRKAMSKGQHREAYDKMTYIMRHYPDTKFVNIKKVDYALKLLTRKQGWKKIAKELKEEEANVYYDWARQLRSATKVKYLNKFMELYPDSPRVADAKDQIEAMDSEE